MSRTKVYAFQFFVFLLFVSCAHGANIEANHKPRFEVFNKIGNYTWIAPKGVTEIWISGCGGDSGGNGYHSRQYYSVTEGSSGRFVIKERYSVTPGRANSITIGEAGKGASGSDQFSTNGGTTSMSGILISTGGQCRTNHTQVPEKPGTPNSSIGESGRVALPTRGGGTPFGQGGVYSWGRRFSRIPIQQYSGNRI